MFDQAMTSAFAPTGATADGLRMDHERRLVPEEGIEPTLPFGERDFESRASASSATLARSQSTGSMLRCIRLRRALSDGHRLASEPEHHRVVATVRGKRVELGVEPKHAEAHKVEPLTIRSTFSFPATDEEGRAAIAAFESTLSAAHRSLFPASFSAALSRPIF
jgi:hypothetical protein